MIDKRFTELQQRTLYELLLFRRDVRGNHFIDKDVSDDDLSLILEAAALSPSVGFSQPWEFVIIRKTETKDEIAAIFKSENTKAATLIENAEAREYSSLKLEGIHAAAINIAVFYTPPEAPVLGQTSMDEAGEYSVVCAIQNMWLMSRALNIGMGWVSILDESRVKKVLNAPENHKLVGYLCLGHVDHFLQKPELETFGWERRKPLHQCIVEEKYRQ